MMASFLGKHHNRQPDLDSINQNIRLVHTDHPFVAKNKTQQCQRAYVVRWPHQLSGSAWQPRLIFRYNHLI
jgi:hypothetical protein